MNTGGPAFPSEGVVTNDGILYDGMTLRDYFAAKAMQSLMAEINENGLRWEPHDVAGLAYSQADAMLKRREDESL